MRSKKKLHFGIFLLLLLLCAGCSQKAEAPQLVAKPVAKLVSPDILLIAGSGSNLALTRRLAEAYSKQSGQKIEVPGSIGTIGAVKAVRAGAIVLGLGSRALTPAEKAQGLKQIRYASIGLAIAVHSSVPETDIDDQTLIQIYSREKTTWRNGVDIVALCMYEGDSTHEVLRKEVPGLSPALQKAVARKSWEVLYSEGAMLETLLRTPNSIGFVDAVALANAKGKLTALRLNGVEMNADSLQTGRYPLKKDLYFIYKDTLPDSAKRFVDYCFSAAGRQQIVDSGAVPMPRGE